MRQESVQETVHQPETGITFQFIGTRKPTPEEKKRFVEAHVTDRPKSGPAPATFERTIAIYFQRDRETPPTAPERPDANG
jgi:hypothetical protein